ncbi:MAG TPA: CoA-binding protein [Nitrososphaerales archaeon]|nr:CoA-binding protein [Nitrososphaerales archaeon]
MISSRREAITSLFSPGSIAVVGATDNPTKRGFRIVKHLKEGGFAGRIYPVNPRLNEIFGLKAYSSLLAIPESVDQVIFAIKAESIPDVLAQCAAKKAKVAIIHSGGFGETGAEGRKISERLVRAAATNDISIVGPNTIGSFSCSSALNGTANPTPLPWLKGSVALISQSGSISILLLEAARMANIGISKFVGVGNCDDIQTEDFLDYLADDNETSIIMTFMEGTKDGKRFMELIGRISPVKPIIVMKVGRTELGARAASSHTASLAVSEKLFDSLLHQYGGIRAEDPAEMIDLAVTLSRTPNRSVGDIGIVCFGGGLAVETADACGLANLRLAELRNETIAELRRRLPSEAGNFRNPVEVTAAHAPPSEVLTEYVNCAELVLADPNVRTIILPNVGRQFQPKAFVDRILQIRGKSEKNIVVIWLLSNYPEVQAELPRLHQANITVYSSIERGIKCLGVAKDYYKRVSTTKARTG